MTASRREILKGLGAGAGAAAAASIVGCQVGGEPEVAMERSDSRNRRMPVLFLGHGTPMNAIEDNRWSRAFASIGRALPRPRAVLAISAHWWTDGTLLTGGTRPRTIHDFGGFPRALHEVAYPAPGSPDLAARVAGVLAESTEPPAAVSEDWGLDHGTWSVLRHMFPDADIPVVQLGIDRRLSPGQHFELARSLRELRGDGVLVLGSGNITHNLRDAFGRMQSGDLATPDWARQFDRDVTEALGARDTRHLVRAWPDGPHARLAHPHPDHWLPLLYSYAATDDADEVRFPAEGLDLGSLSMRAVRWGQADRGG